MPKARPRMGPKTEAGKAALRLNALRHGVLSVSPVVGEIETEEDWREHREGIEASMEPADHLESCLVERIALLLWRLRRVTAFESETMIVDFGNGEAEWEKAEEERKELASIPLYGKDAREHPPVNEEWLRRRQADQMIPTGARLERVMRYEAHPSTRAQGRPAPAACADDARAGSAAEGRVDAAGAAGCGGRAGRLGG